MCFQSASLLIGMVWIPVMNFLLVPYTAECIGEWQDARVVQINFSAAFDRVNHQGILYRLSSVGIGGSVLSVLAQFKSKRSQHVMVDGCRSKLVNVISGVFWRRGVFWRSFPFWKIS